MIIVVAVLVIAFGAILLEGLFFNILNLAFLPAGLDIAANTSMTGVYTIPLIGAFIEVPLHYIFSLVINVVDFLCWFICKIPLIGNIIEFIEKCPDKDLTTHGTDPIIGFLGITGHRNFITHSVLNPYVIIFIVLSVILIFALGSLNEVVGMIFRFLLFFGLLTFSCHLLADCMPSAWTGAALIRVKIFGLQIFTLNGFFSKLWLMLNAIVSGGIGAKLALSEE